ncbi:hypothetical protein D6833_02560 [Candidatus Parcubacteria bacterium]|nr:MAG: hypothetical protein D6833_02560 [Candidatus Parcubacteria bacterium]
MTLDVGAGAGITVNANDVSLTTPGTLSVSSTNNASGNHTHAITASSNPGAAESLLKSDTSGGLTLQSLMLGGPLQDVTNPTLSYLDLDIDGLGTPYDSHVALVAANTFSIAIDSNRNTSNRDFLIGKDAPLPTDAYWVSLFGVNESGDVTIYTGDLVFNTGATIQTTTGDLTLDPAGDDVLPRSSVAVDIGDYNRKWRTLFASELYVETLVAQDVLATIGGRVMVAPTTKLIADVNTTQTTIDVEHNNLVSGGYIYLASAPGGVAQVEVMKVTSGATTISGGYRYSVSRNKDGTGANSWVKGDAVVYLGKNAGEGYIDLTSTQTIHNHLGPTMTIYSRTGSGTWNAVNPVVAVGNLSSFLDYGGDEFGFAVGDDLTLGVSSFSGLAADRTNGLRLFNTDIALYNSGTQTVSIANDGNTWFGADSANKTLQITTTGANAGDVEVGGYSNSGVGMLWDESAGELKIGGSVLVGAGLGPTISDVVAYLPFTRPLGTGDFQVNLQTHLGRSPTTVTGTPIGRPGKFRNGVEVRSVATNEVKNPVFENDVTTGWWFSSSGSTATRTRDTVRKYIGSASCKIDCVSDTYAYQRIDYNISVANGETVWAQARVWRDSSSVSSYVRIRDQTNSVDRATTYSSTTGEWELLFASWTNNTGSSVNVRLQVGVASSGPGVAWFDACQLEASAYPNAFTYGDMPNSSWSGTAHNSTSTSVASGFNFNNDADLLASISPDEGTLAFWFTPQAPLDGTYSGIGWGDYVVVAWNGEDNNSVGVRNNDATGKLQIRIRYNAISYTSGTTLNAGETTHFAFTWSVKDGYIRAYKNGVQVVSASGFTGFPAACDKFAFETCKVGAVISDVFVLSRALTANEVEAIASSNLPVTVSRNNHELLLTGAGAGKVWGYSGGLFGQGADGSPSFALVNEDGVSWDGGTLDSGDLQLGYGTAKLLYDASANVLQIGDISGGDYIALGGGAGITLYSNSKDVVYLSTSGSVRFGTTGANTANLTWNGSDLNLRLNTTSNFRLEGATGSLLMGNGVGSDANIRFAVIGSGGRTVNGESLSSGDVLLGSNVGSKANVLWDESAGQLLFRGGTTTQAYVDTDGKIVAGAGNVWLDTGGVSIYYGAKGIFPPGTSGLKALSDVDSSLQGGLFYWYPSGYPTAYYVSLSCGGYPDVSGVPEFRLGSYNAQKEAYLYNVTHLTVTDGAVNRLGWIMLRRSSETGPYNGAGTTIEFNDTIKKDTTWYAHSTTTNPGDITILSAGWYRVSFTILIKNNLADRSCIYVQLYKNGSLVNGSRAETYIRHQSYGRMGHCSSSFLVYCNQNDVLNLKTGGQAGSSAFYGGGCSYYIEAQSQITIERVGV